MHPFKGVSTTIHTAKNIHHHNILVCSVVGWLYETEELYFAYMKKVNAQDFRILLLLHVRIRCFQAVVQHQMVKFNHLWTGAISLISIAFLKLYLPPVWC
jgi:hypothetical protein